MFEAVLLDAGGVLILPHHGLVVDALAAVGVSLDGADLDGAHYAGSAVLREWPDDDEEILARFTDAYARAAGVPEESLERALPALRAAFGREEMWRRPAPGAAEAIRRLRAAGLKVAVVSNSSGHCEQHLLATSVCQTGTGAGAEVDTIVDSHLVGVAKPDPAIFHLALDRLGVTPDAAVHVGDIVGADVAGARAAGVTPLHMDPYGFCADSDHAHVLSLDDVVDIVITE